MKDYKIKMILNCFKHTHTKIKLQKYKTEQLLASQLIKQDGPEPDRQDA